jgi:hypothetical protein
LELITVVLFRGLAGEDDGMHGEHGAKEMFKEAPGLVLEASERKTKVACCTGNTMVESCGVVVSSMRRRKVAGTMVVVL